MQTGVDIFVQRYFALIDESERTQSCDWLTDGCCLEQSRGCNRDLLFSVRKAVSLFSDNAAALYYRERKTGDTARPHLGFDYVINVIAADRTDAAQTDRRKKC